ncbi:hypothetical protein HKX48_000222 [Thoreauomyces humboldtii]|nr:hypothetical protein HKX48_000222 [Thoreauomyces humboldtii]
MDMDGDECWDDLDLPANGFEDGLFSDANSYQNLFEENTEQFEEEGFTESNPYVDRFAPAQSAESAESRYPETLDFEDDDGEKGGPLSDDTTQQENLVLTEAGLPGAMTGSVQRLTRRTQDIKPQAFEAWRETDNDEIRGIVMTGGTVIETETTRDVATPTPPNSHPTVTATDLEAMEMDFDFPDDSQPLKLANRSSALVSGLVEMGDASTELDLGSDGWGDTLSVHGGLPSLRFGQSSPTPSSAPSIVASESEEGGFDDIEFPDTVEALRLGTFRHALHHDDSEPEGDDADHPFEGLVMPEDGTLDPRMLATITRSRPLVRQETSVDVAQAHTPPQCISPTRAPSSAPASRAATPSKIPRMIPSLLPTPTKHLRVTTTFSSSTPRSFQVSPVTPVSPSMAHFQKLSTQLVGSRRGVGSDPSSAPAKLLRRPKNTPAFGDGSELDAFDDLPFSQAAETKFVKAAPLRPVSVSQRATTHRPVATAPSPRAQSPQKRPLSKSTSTVSMVSGDERENRRPYTPVVALNHRPAKTFVERRGSSGTQKKRQRKKPTLIQNLNNTNLVKVVGDMVYNPALQKWEGNQSALLEFERAAAPTPRPALIANVGGYKTPHAVGGMVFDPVQMRWLGNDDEADVFQDFPDDISVTTESVYGVTGAEMTEFQLPKSLREAVCIAESAHKLFMGKWYPKAILDSRTMIRDTSKTHLYEIRSQTNAGERRRGSMWR